MFPPFEDAITAFPTELMMASLLAFSSSNSLTVLLSLSLDSESCSYLLESFASFSAYELSLLAPSLEKALFPVLIPCSTSAN
jgi:hypothetical protein